MHDSWPSESSIGSTQERQSRVILVSEAHRNTAGEEKACPLQRVDHGGVSLIGFLLLVEGWLKENILNG